MYLRSFDRRRPRFPLIPVAAAVLLATGVLAYVFKDRLPFPKPPKATLAAKATNAPTVPAAAPTTKPAPRPLEQKPPSTVSLSQAPQPPSVPPSDADKQPPPPSVTPVAVPQVANKDARVIVLGFQRIEQGNPSEYSISPDAFEQQMAAIAASGVKVISMDDFLAWRRGERTIPVKSALITIDGGFVSAYTHGRPILKKFGFPWTFFVYLNYVGRGGKSVTWDQLRELRGDGVEIGSYTVSYKNLRDRGDLNDPAYGAWLREELITSKTVISQQLRTPCRVLAYPYGAYNGRVLEIVAEAGYEAAFSVAGRPLIYAGRRDQVSRYIWSSKQPNLFTNALAFSGSPEPVGEPAAVPRQAHRPADLSNTSAPSAN
jgi:peptidoglycan/xylan/chitin deacetylase (PgdA/CDA1 family)